MAGLGYKNFTTGDVLTAGDVDNYLMEQTVMVFADAAARTTALSAVLAEGMFSYLKDTNSTEYYSGSAWTAVAGASGSMTQLASGSLSGALSLTSISGSYKDLVLVLRGIAISNDDLNIRLNADTGSNYAWVQIAANLTSPGRSTGDTKIQMTQPYIQTGNTSNSMYMTVHDYTNTTSFKTVTSALSGNPDGSKSAVWTTGMFASTSAITGISTSNSFSGGTYILYGVN